MIKTRCSSSLRGKIAAATVAGLTALTLYIGPAKADRVSAETFGSQKGVLLEVKAGTKVGSDDFNLQYFTRVRRFRSYDEKNTAFMQNELSIGNLAGFRVVGQGRLVEDHLIPQTGVSYSTPAGAARLYAALTSSLQSPTLTELLVNGSIPLTPRIPLEAEQIFWANENIRKGTSRAHLGLKVADGVMLGLAGELDYQRGLPNQYKAGAFVRLGGR